MNGKGGSGGSLNNFNFDFGIGTNRSRSLNDQKKQSFSSSSPSQPKPPNQPNKPAWTHQPASSPSNLAGLNGPTSMVGDIFGKSWGTSSTPASGVGVANKNPNLFGDLVSSALGSTKSTKSNAPMSGSNRPAPLNQPGSNPAGYNSNSTAKLGTSNGIGKSSNSGNKDPFGSLGDFGSKPKQIPKATETKTGGNVSDSRVPNIATHPQNQKPQPQANKNEEPATTTELEGLPPPPAGVSAATAKSKGIEHKNQGQYADAIKWLSWAVLLFEKASDVGSVREALSSRASCYKEVGEYKKALGDCSRVLEGDKGNVAVLVQRALLFESMEKYKLGAEDLRVVLKIDPANRIARSTIHRLTKMAE